MARGLTIFLCGAAAAAALGVGAGNMSRLDLAEHTAALSGGDTLSPSPVAPSGQAGFLQRYKGKVPDYVVGTDHLQSSATLEFAAAPAPPTQDISQAAEAPPVPLEAFPPTATADEWEVFERPAE